MTIPDPDIALPEPPRRPTDFPRLSPRMANLLVEMRHLGAWEMPATARTERTLAALNARGLVHERGGGTDYVLNDDGVKVADRLIAERAHGEYAAVRATADPDAALAHLFEQGRIMNDPRLDRLYRPGAETREIVEINLSELTAPDNPEAPSPYTDENGDLTETGERYLANIRARREGRAIVEDSTDG